MFPFDGVIMTLYYVYGKQAVYNAIRITVNTYMLRIDRRYKNIMGEGGGGVFCVEYQKDPLIPQKMSYPYIAWLNDPIFIQSWNCKGS